MTSFNQNASDYLRTKIIAMREFGADQASIDAAMAQNILHEDLGYFRSETATYDLDQATRDKLLSHARQDAAHAVYAASTAQAEVRRLRGVIQLLGLAVLVSVGLGIATLVRLYQI